MQTLTKARAINGGRRLHVASTLDLLNGYQRDSLQGHIRTPEGAGLASVHGHQLTRMPEGAGLASVHGHQLTRMPEGAGLASVHGHQLTRMPEGVRAREQ